MPLVAYAQGSLSPLVRYQHKALYFCSLGIKLLSVKLCVALPAGKHKPPPNPVALAVSSQWKLISPFWILTLTTV